MPTRIWSLPRGRHIVAMAKNGYGAVRWMQERTREKRGGNAKAEDGFNRRGQTLAALADAYLEYLRMHNRTSAAVASCGKDLKPFLCWCEERDLCDPRLITQAMIESYQRWLWAYRKKNGQPLGIATQRGHLGGVRSFFAWLCRQHVLPANPASEIEMPRAEKRLPVSVLSIAEIEAVLSQPDICDPLGIRDRAILECFYSTGIRRSELVRMTIADPNREKRLLHVRHGKGNKQRVVPIGVRALAWLEKYLDDVRPRLLIRPEEQGLFLTGYGEPFNADVLGRKVSSYIKQAGSGHKGGAHLLRHTCATHLLEGGADIRYIQQLLGHANLETTAIYTEVSIIQLQAVHARCHPAEQSRLPAPLPPFL